MPVIPVAQTARTGRLGRALTGLGRRRKPGTVTPGWRSAWPGWGRLFGGRPHNL